MSGTESQTKISPSFDRGTLLLTGLNHNQLAETCDSCIWRWDTRVGAWRCDAIHYATNNKTLLERFWIVGFRTPEYPAHRRETLQQFRHQRIIIAVPDKSLREGANIGENVLVYKTVLKPTPLMEIPEKIRTKDRNC